MDLAHKHLCPALLLGEPQCIPTPQNPLDEAFSGIKWLILHLKNWQFGILEVRELRGHIFSCVRPLYKSAVSDIDP